MIDTQEKLIKSQYGHHDTYVEHVKNHEIYKYSFIEMIDCH